MYVYIVVYTHHLANLTACTNSNRTALVLFYAYFIPSYMLHSLLTTLIPCLSVFHKAGKKRMEHAWNLPPTPDKGDGTRTNASVIPEPRHPRLRHGCRLWSVACLPQSIGKGERTGKGTMPFPTYFKANVGL